MAGAGNGGPIRSARGRRSIPWPACARSPTSRPKACAPRATCSSACCAPSRRRPVRGRPRRPARRRRPGRGVDGSAAADAGRDGHARRARRADGRHRRQRGRAAGAPRGRRDRRRARPPRCGCTTGRSPRSARWPRAAVRSATPTAAVLDGAEVGFEPREVDPLPARSSRAVVVSLAAAGPLRPGTYRGTIQAQGAPRLWLPLEVVVEPC